MRAQYKYFIALICSGVLLTLVGCGESQRKGRVPEEVSVLKERVLLTLFSKDKPFEQIKGTSTWQSGDVQIASWDPRAVSVTCGAAYGTHRWSLYAHAPTTVTFPPIRVGKDAHLRFGYYLLPGAYEKGTDGASFRVWCATEVTGKGLCIFEGECGADSELRGVQRAEVPLPVQRGEEVRLSFETDPGPSGQNVADWTAWEMPVLRWHRKVKPKLNTGPNAILFTLDTLRADRLSCYGYQRKTSPNIDALASQGTLMTHAYAQTTTTVPSHISIMTSKYLNEFGIYGQAEDPLPACYRTLAESLKDAGYTTAGFLAAGFMRHAWTGLGQGFDTFVECPVGTLDGEYIVNSAIDWLAAHHGERFFAWIHLYDCHVPYHPPDPFRERFVDRRAAYAPELDPSMLPKRDDEPFERLNRDYYSDCYDGAVAYTDHQVGRVVSVLRDLDVLDKTLIVIAADHGECLGEHSIYFDHVSLYEPNVRVPLILYRPGHVPAGKHFSELCENVDVYPTVLDLLGAEMRGRLSGRSLLPVWSGRDRGREGVTAEHTLHAAVSWRTEEWTYLYQPVADEAVRAKSEGWTEGPPGQWVLHAKKEELYNRREDPDELYDKSDSASEVLEELQGDCAEWVEACDKAWEAQGMEPGSATVDPTRIKQLRALGYVR